ncbi:MAG: thioredoxin family protein [Planctomycetota bacterium]|nr:thioredoxin family protein [Planctomycetota bacterium]
MPRTAYSTKLALALLLGLAAMGTTRAAELQWFTDFEAAKAAAAKDKKDIVVDFTGSDWCGWCIKLKQEVFDQEAFVKEAPSKYVFVELDFPRGKELDPKLKEQNQALMEKYQVRGFPTILMLDSKGELIGRTGYQAGGPEKYLAHLGEIKAGVSRRAELLDKAGRAEGLEKAKMLNEYVELAGKAGMEDGLNDKIDDIIRLDAENKLGLKNKYSIMKGLTDVQQSKTAEEALEKINTLIKTYAPKGEELQQLLVMKGQIAGSKGDRAGLIANLKEALAAAPDSETGKRISEFLAKQEAAGGAPPAEKKGE